MHTPCGLARLLGRGRGVGRSPGWTSAHRSSTGQCRCRFAEVSGLTGVTELQVARLRRSSPAFPSLSCTDGQAHCFCLSMLIV